MSSKDRNKLRRYKKVYPNDAARTTVVIYNKQRKKDIEFCQKTGFRYLFYDVLTEQYAGIIPTWE